jgi:hypothetical protein
MPTKSLRRIIALAGFVLLTMGTMTVAAVPAQAGTELQLKLSSLTVHPGDTVTVTQTMTNVGNFTILNPSARLFSSPNPITSYTSPVSCTGAASCNALNGPHGPVGYQAVLSEALAAGASATVTFTIQVSPNAPDLIVTMHGQLLGSNYAMDNVAGPMLTVDASAGAIVFVTAPPKSGQLISRQSWSTGTAQPKADRAIPV